MDRSVRAMYIEGEVDDRFVITFQDPGAVPGASTRSTSPRRRRSGVGIRPPGRPRTGCFCWGRNRIDWTVKGPRVLACFGGSKMRLSVRTRPVRRRQPLFRAPDQNSKCQRQRRHGDAPRGVIFRGVGTPSNRTQGFGPGARFIPSQFVVPAGKPVAPRRGCVRARARRAPRARRAH